jgi:hypothetical protein
VGQRAWKGFRAAAPTQDKTNQKSTQKDQKMKLIMYTAIVASNLSVLPYMLHAQSNEHQNLNNQTSAIKNQKSMDTIQNDSSMKVLIDRFSMPESALPEFTDRMNYNRSLIKHLPGFVRDDVYEMKDEKGNWTIVTLATWQSQKYMDEAKKAVHEDYKRTGFNMQQFIQQRNIVLLERGTYQRLVK